MVEEVRKGETITRVGHKQGRSVLSSSRKQNKGKEIEKLVVQVPSLLFPDFCFCSAVSRSMKHLSGEGEGGSCSL